MKRAAMLVCLVLAGCEKEQEIVVPTSEGEWKYHEGFNNEAPIVPPGLRIIGGSPGGVVTHASTGWRKAHYGQCQEMGPGYWPPYRKVLLDDETGEVIEGFDEPCECASGKFRSVNGGPFECVGGWK